MTAPTELSYFLAHKLSLEDYKAAMTLAGPEGTPEMPTLLTPTEPAPEDEPSIPVAPIVSERRPDGPITPERFLDGLRVLQTYEIDGKAYIRMSAATTLVDGVYSRLTRMIVAGMLRGIYDATPGRYGKRLVEVDSLFELVEQGFNFQKQLQLTKAQQARVKRQADKLEAGRAKNRPAKAPEQVTVDA